MFGLMQDWPLTTDKILGHAAAWYAGSEVVDRIGDGEIRRRTYRDLRSDAMRLSNAMIAHGIAPGDRVATLAMNGIDHLAIWYAVTGIGAVCHTLNPRLLVDQIAWIVNHAEDRILFADASFAGIVDQVLPRCRSLQRVVLLDGAPDSSATHPNLSTFGQGYATEGAWGGSDERTAAGLCYPSGTTGNPKGVLYSHRSNFLHALTTIQPDVFNLGMRDSILAVVPMYHANAWALTFAAPLVGAKLVLPGARMDGASLFDLMEREQITITAGVPTVWLSLLQYLEDTGQRLATLERVIIGGAACPERVIRGFAALDIEPITAWGMTEMSPVGGVER